ncbi:MAG: metallophosphoesterase [Bacteroidales bacterium]|nr:metallophosphoesterase [Bacteroidales bacterium]
MSIRKIFPAIIACCMLCACQPKLVIIHTNDTHSHFEPLRGGDVAGHGGVIERAAFIDSVRNAVGEDKVLLLHAGDFSQGSSYFTVLGGSLEMRVINDLRYDVMALGNHEFDNGIEAITERARMLEGTQLACANLDLSSFPLGEYVKPYAIVHRGGMKIGVIGMEADISTCVAKTVSSRIPQLDNVEVLNKWADYLHDTEKCDMIILLSHMGYEEDQAIIPQSRWIDLVVGGHTHTFVDDIIYVRDSRHRKVGVVTDGCWGLELGEIKVY